MSSKGKWMTKKFDDIKIQSNKPKPPEEKLSFPKKTESKSLLQTRGTQKIKVSDFNFLKKLEPQAVSELAVHSKKIAEVDSWLDQYAVRETKNSVFLLLTGPSGCGKTTTTQVLCKSKSINVHEWLNPSNYQPQDLEENFNYQSQAQTFFEFLAESKYGNLLTQSAKNLCLVKEYPNIFLKKPEQFVEVLEDISNAGGIKVIFVATEDSGTSTNIERTLLPDEIRTRFAIGTINFNACAATLMKGAIKRAQKLALAYPDLFNLPPTNVIEAICAASNGDIRCCINQFHLAALKGCVNLSVEVKTELPKGTKRKRSTNTVALKTRLKDESLGLFHSIGRVLHPKIDPTTQRIHHDVGALVDEFSTMPSVFLAFMHENYLRHFGDVEDARCASTDLSLSQRYIDKWTERHETYAVGLYIAVMSLMLHNKHRVSLWNPIRGPRKFKPLEKQPQCIHIPQTEICYYNLLIQNQKFDRFEGTL